MARPDPTPLDLTRLHLTRPTSLDSTRIHSTRPNPARLHSTRRVAVHAVRAGGDAPRPTASVPGISEQLAEDRRVVAFGVVGRRRLGPPPRGRAEHRRNLRPPAAAAALRRLEMRRVGRARRTPGGALGISCSRVVPPQELETLTSPAHAASLFRWLTGNSEVKYLHLLVPLWYVRMRICFCWIFTPSDTYVGGYCACAYVCIRICRAIVTVRVHMYLLARFPLSPLLGGLLCVRMRMRWLCACVCFGLLRIVDILFTSVYSHPFWICAWRVTVCVHVCVLACYVV